MINIIILATAHMFGDYVFQNDFLANNKGKYDFVMFVHSWIWSACISIGFVLCDYSINLEDFLFLLASHYLIDKYKCNKKDKTKALTIDLWVDQILHMIQIAMVLIGKIL